VDAASIDVDAGTVSLLDGTVIRFRPIQPADRAALQRFHTRLSDRTVYQRFFGPKPWLSDEQAHYFTNVDGLNRFALVALEPTTPEEIAGVVRFDRDPGTDRAEYAAVVADRWQGRGLGLGLTRGLIAAATRRGIRSFYALVLPDNRRMLSLLRDLGLPEITHHEDGVERIEVSLEVG
jgi:RimJ/RimL family protein N-acetyltransferase